MHPRTETWLAFVDEAAEDVDRDRLRAHLDGCAECRALVEDARRLRAALEGDRLLAPSPGARGAALRSFRRRRAAPPLPRWARDLREKTARLVFDSFAGPEQAFAGARSAGVARRLRFESGGLELDALVETRGDTRRVTAQLLRLRRGAEPVADAPWVVSAGDRADAEGRTDESGELACEIEGEGEIGIRIAAASGVITAFRIPRAEPR